MRHGDGCPHADRCRTPSSARFAQPARSGASKLARTQGGGPHTPRFWLAKHGCSTQGGSGQPGWCLRGFRDGSRARTYLYPRSAASVLGPSDDDDGEAGDPGVGTSWTCGSSKALLDRGLGGSASATGHSRGTSGPAFLVVPPPTTRQRPLGQPPLRRTHPRSCTQA